MIKDVIYPALFVRHKDEAGYAVIFPDIPNSVTQGDTLEDAFNMAVDLLSGMLYDDFIEGKDLPTPSKLNEISYEDYCREEFEEEPEFGIEVIKSYVMTKFRVSELKEKTVTVNCTMPASLKRDATDKNLNFSKILQEGIKEALGISEPIKFK
ncbi:type II toxin-antitoxin system HicB family antitoxin [Paenibacillus tundrae]|uniref:type II toxin-antitoxin system HicB family antitoxin n=1 Tax=Paenibacillus tundrae TaxID=528187 RepID=UPI0022A9E14B|nr:type II toxin-antitoxin system HicB family antitoxin [Paenibacillus tundrae]MCZ1264694.1 type II toxin-antitoxin system HicB family antitoxin [Paenibacillus tundrae]